MAVVLHYSCCSRWRWDLGRGLFEWVASSLKICVMVSVLINCEINVRDVSSDLPLKLIVFCHFYIDSIDYLLNFIFVF